MKRILIVDDDQGIRTCLQEALESEAYEVETVEDGLTAWEKLSLQCENYAMILLDLAMPRMSGIQLIQLLQQRGDGWLLPIIVLSADEDAIQRVLGMGIRHALTKPFDLERLLGLVDICRGEGSSSPTTAKRSTQE